MSGDFLVGIGVGLAVAAILWLLLTPAGRLILSDDREQRDSVRTGIIAESHVLSIETCGAVVSRTTLADLGHAAEACGGTLPVIAPPFVLRSDPLLRVTVERVDKLAETKG